MSVSKKASYTNEFKFKVARDAIKSYKTVAELVTEYNVAKSLIHKWKQQLLSGGAQAFASVAKPHRSNAQEDQLYEQLGRQAVEINFLKKLVNKYQ